MESVIVLIRLISVAPAFLAHFFIKLSNLEIEMQIFIPTSQSQPIERPITANGKLLVPSSAHIQINVIGIMMVTTAISWRKEMQYWTAAPSSVDIIEIEPREIGPRRFVLITSRKIPPVNETVSPDVFRQVGASSSISS